MRTTTPSARSRRGTLPILAAGLVAAGGLAGTALAGAGAAVATTRATRPAATRLSSLAYADVDEADASFASVREGFVSLGRKLGIKVSVYDNKFDASAALTNAQTIANLRPDVAVDWNGVASIGASLGRVFKAGQVPCIAVNTTIPGCPFFNLDDQSLGEQEGSAVGALARRAGWTASDTTLILVNAPVAGQAINALIYGFYTTYAKSFPGMPQRQPSQFSATTTKVADSAVVVNGSADLADTYTAVKEALQTIPTGRKVVVDTLNDDSALGALRALDQAGRTSPSATMLVGNGADPTGLSELAKQPLWVADGTVFLNDWPRLIIAMARAMLAGARTPAVTMPPQSALTKSNMNLYYKGATPIASAPLPAADSYLKRYLPPQG